MRLSLALILLPGLAMADPVFSPRDLPEHIYAGGWEHFVGGGLAAFDCNGDNLPELYAAGGENPAQLMRNHGAFLFTADTPDALAMTGVIGAYPLDIDSDGVFDLAVLRVGQNHLMQGLGDCDFAPFERFPQPNDDRWTTAFSATWEAEQTLPTLAFGNYVDRSNPDGPFEACDVNILQRPSGNAYREPTLLEPGFCALSMLFTDWGQTGRADLRVSNDRHYYVQGGQEQMWAMGVIPHLYGAEHGWNTHQLWGMGIASRDLDGDGIAEVFLTSMGDQRFQVLDGGDAPSYVDVPFDRGTTAHRPYTGGDGRPSTGWHAAFGDVDNDGWDDLFVAKGNVEQMPGSAMGDPNNLLMGAADGVFTEVGLQAGIATLARSRGAALVDLDGDGLLDLAVVNRRAPMELYQNVTEGSGGWVAVDVTQSGANRFAVGAFVEVRGGGRLWTQEITAGGGHASGVAGPLHFGLGTAAEVGVRVIWPDGQASAWQQVDANQRIRIVRDG